MDTQKRKRIAETLRSTQEFVVNTQATIGMFNLSTAINLYFNF